MNSIETLRLTGRRPVPQSVFIEADVPGVITRVVENADHVLIIHKDGVEWKCSGSEVSREFLEEAVKAINGYLNYQSPVAEVEKVTTEAPKSVLVVPRPPPSRPGTPL